MAVTEQGMEGGYGAEISSGVRPIFIAFLALEWKYKKINKSVVKNAFHLRMIMN